jgi:hypothetical protein
MALTGTNLVLAFFGFALVTGCGGHAKSTAEPDRDAGANVGSDGGRSATPNDSGPGANAGAVSSAAGGAPGSAGRGASGGSNTGGAADAGSPSTAGAVGEAGASNSSAAVTAACKSLCTDWIKGCSIWKFAPECTSDCASDLAVQNGACTDLGLAMLSCLTATNGNTTAVLCTTPFEFGLSACRAQVDAFRACAAGGGKAPRPKICLRAGNAFPEGGCVENSYCLDSVSSVLKCANAPNGQSSCNCAIYSTITQMRTSTDFTFDGQSGDLCLNHMGECLATDGAP